MVLMNPEDAQKRPLTREEAELVQEIDSMSKKVLKSLPKQEISAKKAILVLAAAADKINEEIKSQGGQEEKNPPSTPIAHDLAKSAPVAAASAALVTAASSIVESEAKKNWLATSAKPELYSKLSGLAAGVVATGIEYGVAKWAESEDMVDTYWSTSVLVGGVVAISVRMLAAFVPQFFSNPALPTTTATTTTATAAAQTGDFLNVSHAPRKLPVRTIVVNPATRKVLADFTTVPQLQRAAASNNKKITFRSPFAGVPVTQ